MLSRDRYNVFQWSLILIWGTFHTVCVFSQGNTAVVLTTDHALKVSCVTDPAQFETFKRLEFTVDLPAQVTEKINHFLQGDRVPDHMKLNPYLEWETRVYAEFIQPESNDKIVIDGFYAIDYVSWMKDPVHPGPKGQYYQDSEYEQLGGWKERPNSSGFRLRFAPPRSGNWKVLFHLAVNGKETSVSDTLSFDVRHGNSRGYVHLAENDRFLNLGNEPFLATGPNIKWPETKPETDPEFFRLMAISENYRPGFCVPRVYDKYLEYIDKLGEDGVRTVRMMQFPHSTEIEWEHVGDYTQRLYMAQELDRILERCEQNDIYIQWDMAMHYTFKFSPYGISQWDWTDDPSTPADGVNGYGYKQEFGLIEPLDFFTSEEAKRYYKQRIRYILARWGYSDHISVFEIISEISNISNVNYGADSDKFYEQNWQIYRDWMVEMGQYIKSQYYGKVHLLTGSYSGDKALEDDTYESEVFDLMTFNYYDMFDPTFATFYIGSNTAKGKGGPKKYGVANVYLNDDCTFIASKNVNSYTCRELSDGNCKRNIKPLMYAETDPVFTACDPQGTEVRRALWQSVFSGLAGTMSWEIQRTPQLMKDYRSIEELVSRYQITEGHWHPGASRLVDSTYWYYTPQNYFSMDVENGEPRAKKADLIYLRSGDGTMAVGLITNKTYNIYTASECFDKEWDSIARHYGNTGVREPFRTAETVSCLKEGLMLRGMDGGKYEISFYQVGDLDTPIEQKVVKGTSLRLDYQLRAGKDEFMVIVVARKLPSRTSRGKKR